MSVKYSRLKWLTVFSLHVWTYKISNSRAIQGKIENTKSIHDFSSTSIMMLLNEVRRYV